jgi:hypothetical protein
MALITDASNTWSAPVTLVADEIWQARRDGVFLSTAAAPGPEDGLLLRDGSAVQIGAGKTVRYRLAGPGPALIAREGI